MSNEMPRTNESGHRAITESSRNRFGGRTLRFLGMFMIWAALIVGVIEMTFTISPGAYVFFFGIMGGVIHFAGRQLAPGTAGASASGAVVGIIATPIIVFGGLTLIVFLFVTGQLF